MLFDLGLEGGFDCLQVGRELETSSGRQVRSGWRFKRDKLEGFGLRGVPGGHLEDAVECLDLSEEVELDP